MLDIGWLVEQGPCLKFAAGTVIPCPGGQDASQRAMYILLAGNVDVFKKIASGGTLKVASLVNGDVFGGREFFTNVDDSAYITVTEVVVYVITEESFNDLSWSRPDILFEIIRAAYMPMRTPVAAAKAVQQEKAAAQERATAHEKAAVQEKVAVQEKAVAQEKIAVQVKAGANAPEKAVATGKPAVTEAVKTPAVAKNELYPAAHRQYPDYTITMSAGLVFPKDYNCPFCKKTFKDFRVFRSKLYESSPMRYDLRKFYTDFQTEWYDVITCQNCFFSTFHNYFTDPKPIQKPKMEKALAAVRTNVIIDFASERDVNYVFTSHYLAILCSDGYPTMGKQIRAKLWGNLSWLYEDVGDKDMEKFAAAKAAEAYEQVYTESRLTPIQEQITCLSIAGMQQRAGIDNNLKKFLFTAKTSQTGDRLYSKLAEDFMYELKMED